MKKNFISNNQSLNEITLRKYERPLNIEKRELIKKFCLSIGLLQESDSRDIIVDILYVILINSSKKQTLTSIEIRNEVYDFRKENNLALIGLADSNIRRQLKRLKDLMIIEKKQNVYYINEFLSLSEIFQEKIQPFIIDSTIQRLKDYIKKIDSEFKLNEEVQK